MSERQPVHQWNHLGLRAMKRLVSATRRRAITTTFSMQQRTGAPRAPPPPVNIIAETSGYHFPSKVNMGLAAACRQTTGTVVCVNCVALPVNGNPLDLSI